jgi:apolipoprotein N-acyltransferase
LIRLVFNAPLLAFGAGVLSVLGFAPFGLSPAPLVALTVLFLLWREASPGRAFLLGWLFGLGLMGVGVFWVRISLNQFGNLSPALALSFTLLLVVGMSLYFGLAGWLGRRLAGRTLQAVLLLVFPATWVLAEWLRGWVLTGFPWLALGYSQIDSPLAGYAPLGGVYALSWLLALSAGLLALAIRVPGRVRYTALGAGTLLWLGGWLLQHMDWTEPLGDAFRASLVQANIPQEEKWRAEQLLPTLRLYRDLTREHWDSAVVVWPETAVPALKHQVRENFLEPLANEARQHDAEVVLGIPIRDPRDGRYFNALISLGSAEDVYHKRHLVPFGEFMPFKDWLGPLAELFEVPMSDFSPSRAARPLLKVGSYAVGASICYEDAFPAEVLQALPEAAYLINVSNDAWFGDSLAPHQHLEIARMRALESGRYLLRATNTGISAIIDPKGKLLGTVAAFQQGVLTREVVPMAGATPYAKLGNEGILALLAVLLGLSLLMRMRADESE